MEQGEIYNTPNQWIGAFPDDVDHFDFTSMEDDYRLAIFGRDDWVIHASPPPLTLETIGHEVKERRNMETTYQTYLGVIDPVLHCSLLNWMVDLDHTPSELEKNVALALQNILVRGNSKFRALASEALACLKGLDRHITGILPR